MFLIVTLLAKTAFSLEKEIIAKSSHPTHENSSLFWVAFFTMNYFLLFLPHTVGMDGERQFPYSCSHLAHAFAFPVAPLQKGTAPMAVTGLHRSSDGCTAPAQPGSGAQCHPAQKCDWSTHRQHL